MPPFKDLTGKRFGRLVVIEKSKSRDNRIYWLCKCNCGAKTVVASGSLLSGNTRSCGCLNIDSLIERNISRRTHGMKNTRVYHIWRSMRQRCEYPGKSTYSLYGGRGIKVCSRWNKFENFLEDMGVPPSNSHSIDRVDSNGDYEPSNCRWATQKEQQNNRRNNRLLHYQDQCMTLAQWADLLGISRTTLQMRLSSGWSIEDTLSTPLMKCFSHPRPK